MPTSVAAQQPHRFGELGLRCVFLLRARRDQGILPCAASAVLAQPHLRDFDVLEWSRLDNFDALRDCGPFKQQES